jgi:PEGA domain
MSMLANLKTRATRAEAPRPAPAAAVARKATGTLNISSSPPGAKILVDGRSRGVTPVELTDVSPGRHEIALSSDAGSVHRTVTVAAGKTITLDEPIFSGWVAVYSPIEISVAEGGRVLRPDDRNQIMLPSGVHELRFVNKAFAYDTSRQVEIKPGEGTTVRLTPEPSKATVTATEAAEVWVDGARLGDTPLTDAPVPLGTHEIVVRRKSDGTERRFTVTIGVAPFTLLVDFSHPGA